MIKVSIIIPVYNVGEYVRECMDSVLAQTVGDIEVICVDDGSTDNSQEILREYAARDGRVHVVVQENKGPAAARNKALSIATGKYVSFMDPDDLYADSSVLATLVDLAEKSGCEVAGGYLEIFGGDKADFLNENWMNKNRYPQLGIVDFADYQSPFGYQRYIFSREMLARSGILFPDLRRFQDPPFCAYALNAARRFVATDKIIYRYRKQHSVVDWLKDDGVRAKHWIAGQGLLLKLAVDNGYDKLAKGIARDFRTVLPREVTAVPEIGAAFRQLALAAEAAIPKPSRMLFVCANTHSDFSNPFVPTLARALEEQGVCVDFGRQKFLQRCESYQVIHFMWPEAVFDWHKESITHADVIAIRDQIRYARAIGIHVCYTRHNLHPHYVDLPNLDDLYRTIESECDTIIHMGKFSQTEYEARYDYPLVKHAVIPHHLYGQIDRSLSKQEARKKLGLLQDEKVLLAFGMFRAEEECRLTVDGYREASQTIPRLRLLAPRLPKEYGFGEGSPVKESDIPLYFAAADVVMIPRREILNSGNLPLAFYFGKPVVGPGMGNVKEILEETGNSIFADSSPRAVAQAIVDAFAKESEGLGLRNREYADRNWNACTVAQMHLEAYGSVMTEAQMLDVRKYIMRNNGVAPATWALDVMFETVWEAVMARSIQDFTPDPSTMTGNGIYKEKYSALPAIVSSVALSDSVEEPEKGLQYAFLWGNGHYPANACVLGAALKYGARMIICEDGWLRSADTWANMKAAPRYRNGCSLILESRGCYYDATRVSTVEMMLNDRNLVVSEEERAEARRLIRRIVDNKLSKYNHQPIYTPDVGRPGKRKVLVVDQSYGDFAIRKGWANDSTFANMLKAAIDENPDADVLVKTHPDTMTGTRKGYYDNLREHGNVFRVTVPINPYSLMEVVDKVYVCSTQFGFEALMAGKEVHVFGMPFYAGWGLTVDAQKNPRRTNTRTLEEVFHIFYLRYTHWMNPETGKCCGIDDCIDYLLRLRDEYRVVLENAENVTLPPPPPRETIESVRAKLAESKKWANLLKTGRDRYRAAAEVAEVLGTLRIDILNSGAATNRVDVKPVLGAVVAESPKWFRGERGIGTCVNSVSSHVEFDVTCHGQGKLTLELSGPNVGPDKRRLPVVISYFSVKIDGVEQLANPVVAWHDHRRQVSAPVRSKQKLRVSVFALPGRYEVGSIVKVAQALLGSRVPAGVSLGAIASEDLLKSFTTSPSQWLVSLYKDLRADVASRGKQIDGLMHRLNVVQRNLAGLQASISYRLGRAATWPARKTWGGIKCLRENGVRYTVKHAVGKVLRLFGAKVKW